MLKFKFIQNISNEIFEQKYMGPDDESVDSIFKEVSTEIASVESKPIKDSLTALFHEELSTTRFIPGGRIFANARSKKNVHNYINCFTINIEDSIESIADAIKEYMLILKSGGGVGFNASAIRPEGAVISTGGITSGVMSFLEIFNTASAQISVAGNRRGASIVVLNIDHPEIEKFITYKQGDENEVLKQFNISVGVSDAFMEALKNDGDWDLVFNQKVYKTVKAKYLYDLITKNAFEHNEPGLFNLDTVNKNSNSRYLYYIQTVNPCGEQPLPIYGSCDLGALNLSKFILHPFTSKSVINWKQLRESISLAVRFLDNVLDTTEYPLKKIKKIALSERRIGLGFTAYGDMLSMLQIIYGSEEANKLTEKLGAFFRDVSYETSIELAKEKGSFNKFDFSGYSQSEFYKRLPKKIQKDIEKYGIRNIAINTVAPTGTTSFSLGQNCSSGIEPIFSLQYDRTIRFGKGDETKVETVYDNAWLEYLEYLKNNNFEFSGIPPYFIISSEVDPYDHVKVQSIWQTYIDASISKTVNLPKKYTLEQYQDLYKYAYDLGLKGITSFNPSGSMKGILEDSETSNNELKRTLEGVIIRPKKVPCDIHEVKLDGNNYLVLVGILDGRPYEVFVTANIDKKDYPMKGKKKGVIHKVKKGLYNLVIPNGENQIYIEDITNKFDPIYLTLGRFISMSLRSNHPLQFIAEQLLKDKNFVGFEKTVGRVLKKYISQDEKVKSSTMCENCGSTNLVYRDGCVTCLDCANSICG